MNFTKASWLIVAATLAACGGSDTPVSDPATVEGNTTETTPEVDEPVVPAADPCATSISTTVTTNNKTDANGDLCAAFNRVIASMDPSPLDVGPGFEIQISLTELTRETTCKLTITIFDNREMFGMANAAATVEGADDLAARDCIDAVLEDLLSKKIGSALQDRAAP